MSEGNKVSKQQRRNAALRERRKAPPTRDVAQPETVLPRVDLPQTRAVVWRGYKGQAAKELEIVLATERLHADLWALGGLMPDADANDPAAQQLGIWQQNLIAVLDFCRDIGLDASQLLGLDSLMTALNERSLGGAFPAPLVTGRPIISGLTWERRTACVALMEIYKKEDSRANAAERAEAAARKVATDLMNAGARAMLYGVPEAEAEQRKWVRAETIISWRRELYRLPIQSADRQGLHKLLKGPLPNEERRAKALLYYASFGLSDRGTLEQAAREVEAADQPAPQTFRVEHDPRQCPVCGSLTAVHSARTAQRAP